MHNMLQLDPLNIPTAQLHGYLLGAIGPRPIAFASTVDKNGQVNLSPFSFFNVFSAAPPVLIFSPARRVRDNSTKHTLENALETKEVVINVVNHALVEQMSLSSTEYSKDTNEFIKSGLTELPSLKVTPPRVKESPVQFECKVTEVKALGDQGGAGNLIFCEVVQIHISPDILDDNQKIDTQKIDLVGRMGGNWYCRANGSALFEVAKPLSSLGIGFDQLPEDILQSTILSGNDLGKLANVNALPNETDVNDYKLVELSDLFIEFEDEPAQLEIQLHQIAKQHLEKGEVELAWKTLLTFNDN